MKTITLFTVVVDVCGLSVRYRNPKSQRALIELNKHVIPILLQNALFYG